MKEARTIYRIRAVTFTHQELLQFLREKVNKEVTDCELEFATVDQDGMIHESANVAPWQDLQISWQEVL